MPDELDLGGLGGVALRVSRPQASNPGANVAIDMTGTLADVSLSDATVYLMARLCDGGSGSSHIINPSMLTFQIFLPAIEPLSLIICIDLTCCSGWPGILISSCTVELTIGPIPAPTGVKELEHRTSRSFRTR